MAANKAKGESTFKTMVYPVIILVVICVVCSAALAVLNDVTAPIIAANEAAQTQEAYLGVLPAGTDAASLVTHDGLTTEGVIGAVTAPDGTIAVQASAAGTAGWRSWCSIPPWWATRRSCPTRPTPTSWW